MHRTPNPYYQKRNYGENNFQWRPNIRPRIYHQNRDMFFNVNSGVNINNVEQHWCETCDKGFPTLQYLEKHKQQHQKCNIDGCQFVAHPKVITKHIQMQHSTGLYSKIAKLSNPEEITKWIEERKKKYPTKLNIEKKNAAVQEKIERGEKMGLKDSHPRRNHSSDKGIGVKRKFDNKNYKHSKSQVNQNGFKKSKNISQVNAANKSKQLQETVPICRERKLRPFAGIQSMNMESDVEDQEEIANNFVIDDDDLEEVKLKNNNDLNEPTVCGALSALMCNYESSDEEIHNLNEGKICNKTMDSPKIVEKINKDVQTYENKIDCIVDNDEEDSGPEEVKIVKNMEVNVNGDQKQTGNNPNVTINGKKNNTIHPVNKKRPFNRSKPKLPSTLLRKLLHKEMQHERNIVLQCVRHIVKNNYFDK